MILYYNKPETNDGTEKSNIFIDFASIHARVKQRFPESTLYRLLRKRCKAIRYQNRALYPYDEILNIPEIVKELKENG
jgi:hypothetical protein